MQYTFHHLHYNRLPNANLVRMFVNVELESELHTTNKFVAIFAVQFAKMIFVLLAGVCPLSVCLECNSSIFFFYFSSVSCDGVFS